MKYILRGKIEEGVVLRIRVFKNEEKERIETEREREMKCTLRHRHRQQAVYSIQRVVVCCWFVRGVSQARHEASSLGVVKDNLLSLLHHTTTLHQWREPTQLHNSKTVCPPHPTLGLLH